MLGRAGFRLAHAARPRAIPHKRPLGRRTLATDAAPAQQGIFSRIWNSPVGVKTVHFWAPVMKWSIVIAGINDLRRPAEKLSLNTNLALTATGTIWTRWCFVIRPQNYLLAAVNLFLAVVGITQVTRIMLYKRSLDGKTAVEAIKEEAKQV